MRKYSFRSVVIIALVAVGGISGDARQLGASPQGNENNAAMEKNYIELSYTELEEFKQKVNSIHIGEKREEVKAVLGKPFSEDIAKDLKSGHIVGWKCIYYVRKQHKTGQSDIDRFVYFRFDKKTDQLQYIWSTVPEIPSRPAPEVFGGK